jgi:hypothetical protein
MRGAGEKTKGGGGEAGSKRQYGEVEIAEVPTTPKAVGQLSARATARPSAPALAVIF